MAFVHLFPLPASKTSLVVLLTNIALAVATIPVIIRLVRILGGGTLAITATLMSFVLSRDSMTWTAAGFETAMLTFLFHLTMYRVVQESKLNQPKLSTYLFIAIMSLVRADAAILSGLAYAVSLLLNKNRKEVVIYSVISLILPFTHELFRICYYDDILPNTAYLKTVNWNGKYAAGLTYVIDFVKHYGFLIGFAVAGSIFSRQWSLRILLGAFLLYVAYVAYVGGDAFSGFRFFVPFLPVLMILAFLGMQTLIPRQAPRLAISTLCLATIPLIIPGYTIGLSPKPAAIGNIRIGLLLKQNTPSSSKVADFWAGSVLYFSERYGIDLLGKSDRYIARLPAAFNGTRPGHNKFDFDYSLGVLRPDFVVANFKLPVREDEMRQAAVGNWAFTGQLYFDSVFREHCLENPVTAETWRTIFACDWSPQIEKKNDWLELSSEK